MKTIKLLVLCSLALLGIAASSLAQIDVTIPDTTGEKGTSVSIPVYVGDLTAKGVISYQFVVSFSSNVLNATGAQSEGTLTSSWGPPTANTGIDGQVTVGGFGTSELSGSGVLVYLNFDVIGEPGVSTDLEFTFFVFNAGDPSADAKGGKFRIPMAIPNQPPNGVIDTPIEDVTINEGDLVNFTGTGTDPDNDIPLTYLWDFAGCAPKSTQEDPGSIVFDTPGTYIVTFTVTDSKGLADPTPDMVTINVNHPPTADAGVDQTFTLAIRQSTVPVTLDGSGSSDIDGEIVSYLWTGTPDPDDMESPTVTLSVGTHTFVLVVTDDDAATSAADEVEVIVNPARLEMTTTSVPDAAVGTFYSATLAATGGVPAYSWSIISGSLPAGLSLVNSVISGTATTVGTYPLTVQVTDSSTPANVDIQDLMVTVFVHGSGEGFSLQAKFDIASDLTGTAWSWGGSGDIDGDGIPELVMCLFDTTHSTILENGRLIVAKYQHGSLDILYERSGYLPCGIVDFDGDGKDEILSWDDFALGYDGRGLQPEGLRWPWACYLPALADIDNDGTTELVTTSQMSNSLLIFMWDGSQLIQEKSIHNIEGHGFWSPALTGDIDNDGKIEIVASLLDYYDTDEKRYHWFIVVLEYQDGAYIVQSLQRSDFWCQRLIDYDSDGNLEVVWVDYHDSSIHAAQYDTSINSFREEWSFVFGGYSGMASTPNFTIGDADNDGVYEVLVGLGGHCEVPDIGPGLYVFGHGIITRTDHPYGVFSTEVGDFNGDGKNEIAVWTYDNDLRIFEYRAPTAVAEQDEARALPESHRLFQNCPNPFNALTIIQYQLPESSKITLSIYNLRGQKIRKLVDGDVKAGYHSVVWDGRDNIGRAVASGIYIYRLRAGQFGEAKRMLLLK